MCSCDHAVLDFASLLHGTPLSLCIEMLQQSCSELRPLCFALSSPFVLSRIGHSAFSPNTGNSSARLAPFSPHTDIDVETNTSVCLWVWL